MRPPTMTWGAALICCVHDTGFDWDPFAYERSASQSPWDTEGWLQEAAIALPGCMSSTESPGARLVFSCTDE